MPENNLFDEDWLITKTGRILAEELRPTLRDLFNKHKDLNPFQLEYILNMEIRHEAALRNAKNSIEKDRK